MLVFGTRPEAIKLAPVVLALARSNSFEPVVAVTAQHREMLDQVLATFGIVPARDLNIIKDRQTLTDVTVRALEGLSPVIAEEQPDAVIVQGDTTTTFVGALAAFYHRIPAIHVEAGLRTGDPYSPYPEEINRRLTTQLTSLHLAPTKTAKRNLLGEGVDESRIVVTGNTVIDALLWTVERPSADDDALNGIAGKKVVLVTATAVSPGVLPWRPWAGPSRPLRAASQTWRSSFPSTETRGCGRRSFRRSRDCPTCGSSSRCPTRRSPT